MRFLTAGESHGAKLTVIVDSFPGGVQLDPSFFNAELKRRKVGYGRGKRMQIEEDNVTFTSGVRFGETTGAPISMEIENLDHKNWKGIMEPFANKNEEKAIYKPRPGHADLPGVIKYHREDVRDILERASARETAARVAVGALAKCFLKNFGIEIYSFVWEIGGVGLNFEKSLKLILHKKIKPLELHNTAEKNDLRMPLEDRKHVYERIDKAKAEGTSLGGVFTVVASNVPPGLGSHIQFDTKLDGQLSMLLMSIPAVKLVSIGGGFFSSKFTGKQFHDAIFYSTKRGVYRKTNYAGGIEGGITNGEDIVLTCFMKPIPTMLTPLPSFNLKTLTSENAVYERSDVTAVPACSVVAEAMLAIGIANVFMDKFGKDSLAEIKQYYNDYQKSISKLWKKSI